MPEITPEQLQRLRALPDDADQDAIDAAIAGTEPEAEVEPVTPETPEVDTPVTEREPEPVAASTVTFDRDTAAQMQADARAGREARDEQIRTQRDGLVEAAVQDGRVPPARREHWRAQLDADPGAEAVLAGLEKGLIPVTERGVAASSEAQTTNQGTGWFPKLDAKEA